MTHVENATSGRNLTAVGEMIRDNPGVKYGALFGLGVLLAVGLITYLTVPVDNGVVWEPGDPDMSR